MQLPALLPPELASYAPASTAEELLNALSNHPRDFVHFFYYACEDETWCDENGSFMRGAIAWFTEQTLQAHLSVESLAEITRSIYAHHPILNQYLPNDFVFNVQGMEHPVNMLLFLASGPYLRNVIQRAHFADKERVPRLDLTAEQFFIVKEFIHTGTVTGLWKLDQEGLFSLLRLTARWQLFGLMELCQETLKRYIDADNVVDVLLLAHANDWKDLLRRCFEFINEQAWGVTLESVSELYEGESIPGHSPLAIEFIDFSENARSLFAKLRNIITHVICSGSLTEDTAFFQIIGSTPHLIAVDISRTRSYSEYALNLPPTLQALDLSRCGWLTLDLLKRFIAAYPQLRRLGLSYDTQFNYRTWGELQNLPNLSVLDLSHSHQLRDDDIALVVKSCAGLISLNLEGCKGLTARSFVEIVRYLPGLNVLNVMGCEISNGILAELTLHCTQLRVLNIARCSNLTEKGILDALELAVLLREVVVSRNQLGSSALSALNRVRPELQVVIR